MPKLTRRLQLPKMEQKHKPLPLKNCVTSVAAKYGGDTSRAFAICTTSLQKAGELKPGSQELTAKGKKMAKKLARSKGADAIVADYEKALAAGREESVGDEVLTHLSEDYRLLSGIVELKAPKAVPAQKWEVPAPAEPKDSDSLDGQWERVLSKKGFKPSPGQQFTKDGDETAALKALEAALIANSLPMTDGSERQVGPKEFIYQGRHVDENGRTCWTHFKHQDTRNFVHLDMMGQKLLVPVQRKLFQYGTFDKVEHSEQLVRFRALAGIGDL